MKVVKSFGRSTGDTVSTYTWVLNLFCVRSATAGRRQASEEAISDRDTEGITTTFSHPTQNRKEEPKHITIFIHLCFWKRQQKTQVLVARRQKQLWSPSPSPPKERSRTKQGTISTRSKPVRKQSHKMKWLQAQGRGTLSLRGDGTRMESWDFRY